MVPKIMRVLIVEDKIERQEILSNLYRAHAWILVHTAARAINLLRAYDFDLISLDYDLAGPSKGEEIAAIIPETRNANARVLIHSMNDVGAKRIMELLPKAEFVPISKITRDNATFKRAREEVWRGLDLDWGYVFSGRRKSK